MSIKNKNKRLIFFGVNVYNIKSGRKGVIRRQRASFRFDCRQRIGKAYQRLGFVKYGNLNLNAESKDSKVVAFPSMRRASVACAA